MAPSAFRCALLLLAIAAPIVSVHAACAATVSVSDSGQFAFDPATVSIGVGDTVCWTDLEIHSVTQVAASGDTSAMSGGFNSGVGPSGSTYQHTFATAGTYFYFCSVHTYMQASVKVGSTPSTPSPPTPSPPTPSPKTSSAVTAQAAFVVLLLASMLLI